MFSKSVAIAHVVYESNWYHLSPKYVKTLQLILLRGQIPFQLTAGGFFVLSAETFTLVSRIDNNEETIFDVFNKFENFSDSQGIWFLYVHVASNILNMIQLLDDGLSIDLA